MNIEHIKLITEINNLLYILSEFCEKTEQDEKINAVTSMVKCLYEKSETLYIGMQK